MKKKVRYALAIAGAAPVLATMMPANPVIAATASPAKTAGKSVSVRQIRGPAVDTCGGTKSAHASSIGSGTQETFFYKNEGNVGVCIGTVEWNTATNGGDIRIYAHSHGGHTKHLVFSRHVNGHAGNYGVRRQFSYKPVQVCFHPVSPYFPACKSVS
jgi:hypothetical protein